VPAQSEDDLTPVDFNQVSPAYFRTLRIPLLEGRTFDATDGPESPRVAVVSRTLRDRVWPDTEALGRSFSYDGADGDRYTVVGVVEDVKNQVVTESPKPFVYTLLSQGYRGDVNLLVRTAGIAAGSIGQTLRAAVLEADPSLSMRPVVSVADYTAIGLLPQRMAASIASVLGLVALLLSGIGIYGVVALSVAQRTREIGVRMALGAGRTDVVVRVIRRGLATALPGVVAGLVLSVAVARVLRSLLLGVSPVDPPTLGAVCLLLLGTVLLGILVPARKASRTDPMRALRCE